MALGLLQLCLTLLWALMTQATNSAEKALWRPSLSNSPKQGGFQDKKAVLPRGLSLGTNKDSFGHVAPSHLWALLIASPLQFQGKWGIMAWALNTFVNESLSNMDMVSTTFELKDDHSYSVTSLWYSSDQGCFTQQDRLVRSGLRSQYIMEDVTRYKGLQSFTMKVLDTNYRDYAVVFYHANVDNKEYIECILYAECD
ncbi:PREDICTED: neutrophil gelatinase-associated lipocalin-like [Chinchilla lanigera]|uniref:neutrophil gelatinase-associated lipocalin-like n=1 Tax=Chinchilla lanigera TaxID=34839 RepID=UPI0006966EBF|nr:PREDICTED: neutrophil gelatinase-associated lipocalin-like [Chinchilla lanigera]